MNLPVVKYDNLKTSLEKFERMVKNKAFQEILNEGGDPSALLTDKLIRKLGGLGVDGKVIRDHFLETVTKRNGQTEQLKFQVENGICRVEVKIDGTIKETVTAEEYFARDDTPNSLSQLILAVDYVAMVDPPTPLNEEMTEAERFPDLLRGNLANNEYINSNGIVFNEPIVCKGGNIFEYLRIRSDASQNEIIDAIYIKQGWSENDLPKENLGLMTFKLYDRQTGELIEGFIYSLSNVQNIKLSNEYQRYFNSEVVGNAKFPRDFDSEIKMGEIINQIFGLGELKNLFDPETYLKMYTGYPPCPSCSKNTIRDLIYMYGDKFSFTWNIIDYGIDNLLDRNDPDELYWMNEPLYDMLVNMNRIVPRDGETKVEALSRFIDSLDNFNF